MYQYELADPVHTSSVHTIKKQKETERNRKKQKETERNRKKQNKFYVIPK